MEKFIIVRDEKKDLRFTGVKLAEATNRKGGSDRWYEVALYKTQGGKYVLRTFFGSLWQGEISRRDATVHATAKDVLEVLIVAGELHETDKELLQEAAEADEAFAGLWQEEVE